MSRTGSAADLGAMLGSAPLAVRWTGGDEDEGDRFVVAGRVMTSSIHGVNCPFTLLLPPPQAGATSAATGRFVEDHAVAALRQIKRRNANVSTVLYHDSMRMWTNDQVAGIGRIGPQRARLWNPTVFAADDRVVSEHPGERARRPPSSRARKRVITPLAASSSSSNRGCTSTAIRPLR